MPRRLSTDPVYGADVLCLAEAACRLGMHPKTYITGVELGHLPGTKFNKTVVIPRRAYERYLDDGRMPKEGQAA
jgi:hypothetical protein